MKFHIIVLNLERSPDRKKLMEEQFIKLNITNYSFFPAFDGKLIINTSFVASIIKGSGMGRKMTNNELSIIMSHIGALKFAQIMNYDNVVILEDDVVLCEDWEDRMEWLLKALPESWEYVYLAGHSDFVKLPYYDTPTIIKAPPMIGAFSYLINQSGISKLIKFCSEFVTTYDDMIMFKIRSEKLNGYYLCPYMTYHRDNISTLWEGLPSVNHPSINYFKNRIDDQH
jgi:GR25 family glycosyltransferase involved in LPS biosynthesis